MENAKHPRPCSAWGDGAALGPRRTPPRVDIEESGFARIDFGAQETFNFPWAVYKGTEKALGAIRSDTPVIAVFSLSEMLGRAGVKVPSDAVDYLSARFLAVPARASDRETLTRYLRQRSGDALDYERRETEAGLRETLHLILSLPEAQIS